MIPNPPGTPPGGLLRNKQSIPVPTGAGTDFHTVKWTKSAAFCHLHS